MSTSRDTFLEQHRVLRLVSVNPATFDDPVNSDKDLCAKLFRSSLAVSIFSTLETFIRNRTAEVLAEIDHRTVNFSTLPEGIQKAATIGAVRALNFRLQQIEKNQRQLFAIQHASRIASAANTSYDISSLSFGNDRSNIGADDVDEILSSFLIDSGWNKIKILATRVGFGGATSYDEAFRVLASRRHLSAHTLDSRVSQSDIVDSLSSICAIAIAFDLIISKCGTLIKDRDQQYLNGTSRRYPLDPNALPFGTIMPSGGGWKFLQYGARRSTCTNADRAFVFHTGLERCNEKKIALVEFAANGQPCRWHC